MRVRGVSAPNRTGFVAEVPTDILRAFRPSYYDLGNPDMRTSLPVALLLLMVAGCSSAPGGVGDKVLQDFGIRERSEDYISGEDAVRARLDEVGKTEIKRLNLAARSGEVKFEEQGELRGKFYKEIKVYKNHYPLDVDATGTTRTRDRGYVARIEYSYRVYQGPRKSTRAAASAEVADIATSLRGRETYRYRFSARGTWDSVKGVRARR